MRGSGLFSIYDRKAEVFGPVFGPMTTGIAIRDFEAAVKSQDSKIATWPEDFSLHMVGEFDCVSGDVEPRAAKVAEALDFHVKVPEVMNG